MMMQPQWQARLFSPEDLSGGTGGGKPSDLPSGGTPNPDDFFEGLSLSAEDREWSTSAGIKDARSLFDFAHDRHKEIGHRPFRRPADDASDEDKASYRTSLFKELGTPADAAAYELAPPAEMPENVPYDAELGDWFRGAAHKANLPADSAKSLHDDFVNMRIGKGATSLKDAEAELIKFSAEQQGKMEKSYGAAHGTQEFDGKMEIGFRTIRAFGGEPLIKELVAAGDLIPDPEKEGQFLVLRAELLTTFTKIGEELIVSGGLPEGDTANKSSNPFGTGKEENMTKQSEIIERDKEEAVRLILRAGRKPANWGL